ncbi:hypothetical protein ACFOPX_07810 [Helicobacter baculiformis]|uniref:OMP1458 n=1 Tax=Helicobacter baculiformis TaxID=427351 RepID=A0A1M4NHL7_9HELI|nr:hypothetical protein [Helicobacter baculiformis]SFZ71479.1 OMP1458 [Helicobacter baculiformis]
MELKDNLKQVQEEFKSDEKLLESAFRIEKFYHKYKFILWALVGLALIWWGVVQFLEHKKAVRTQEITALYNEVLQNPNNLALLDKLKRVAPDLYSLHAYARALRDKNIRALRELITAPNPLVSAFARYYSASYDEDLQALEKLQLEGMQDWITLQKAYLILQENPKGNVKPLLSTISPTSSLYQVATLLRHYGVQEHTPSSAPKKSP